MAGNWTTTIVTRLAPAGAARDLTAEEVAIEAEAGITSVEVPWGDVDTGRKYVEVTAVGGTSVVSAPDSVTLAETVLSDAITAIGDTLELQVGFAPDVSTIET